MLSSIRRRDNRFAVLGSWSIATAKGWVKSGKLGHLQLLQCVPHHEILVSYKRLYCVAGFPPLNAARLV